MVGTSKVCNHCGSHTEECTPKEVAKHDRQLGVYRSEPPMPRARGKAMTPLHDFEDNWG